MSSNNGMVTTKKGTKKEVNQCTTYTQVEEQEKERTEKADATHSKAKGK